MNKQLQEELRIRKWISNILTEEMLSQDKDLMIESIMSEGYFVAAPEDMWNTFVAPFTDVLKVAAVGGKEILSAAKLSFDVLTSIRPSTIAKAKARYEKRSEALSAEWAEVMQTTDQALEGDAQLIGFLANPTMFLGAKFGAKAAGVPGGVVQYLEDAGWHVPLVGDILGIDKDTRIASQDDERAKAAATPLLNKIAGFFFMAHHAPSGPLLAEAEKEEEKKAKKKKGGNSPKDIQDYLERVGLVDKIQKDAQDLIDAKKEQVELLMKPFEAQVKLLDQIYTSQSLQDLAAALNSAGQAGLDLDAAGLSNFEQQVNSEVEEILNDPKAREEFVTSYIEKSGEKPKEGEPVPEVSNEKLKPEIEKVIFMSSTKDMQDQIYTGVQKMKEQMKQELSANMPEGDLVKMLKSSKMGQEFISVITDAVKKVESI